MKHKFKILTGLICLLTAPLINNAQTYIDVIINQPSLPPTPTITQSGDLLTSSSPTANQWFELSNGIIVGATEQTYTITVNGNYYVVVGDNNGCWSDSSNIISYFSNTQLIDANSSISLFPNPSSDLIYLNLVNFENKNITVEIVNSIGQSVFSKHFVTGVNNTTETLDITDFNNGIYMIKVKFGEDHRTFRIIKN